MHLINGWVSKLGEFKHYDYISYLSRPGRPHPGGDPLPGMYYYVPKVPPTSQSHVPDYFTSLPLSLSLYQLTFLNTMITFISQKFKYGRLT